jgi:hypothetical protein
MIAFCTSLRARALSRDWAHHTWLLDTTIHSMLAQQQGDVRVVVGCHDIPDTRWASDPRVRFEPVTIAHPARTFDDMSVDKVIKHSVAARWAIAQGADYVVFNDADDLVSDRIGEHVAANRGAHGWYTESQWLYTYGGYFARLVDIAAPKSGPCVIVRSDLLQFDSPPYSGAWVDLVKGGDELEYLELLARHGVPVCTLAAAGHWHYTTLMAQLSHPLQPLPFPGNLVINHGDSMSTAGGRHGFQVLSHLAAMRRFLGVMPLLRWASAALKREYHVPPADAIPPSSRGNGSVFWRST